MSVSIRPVAIPKTDAVLTLTAPAGILFHIESH
jgi:hypothetical protein